MRQSGGAPPAATVTELCELVATLDEPAPVEAGAERVRLFAWYFAATALAELAPAARPPDVDRPALLERIVTVAVRLEQPELAAKAVLTLALELRDRGRVDEARARLDAALPGAGAAPRLLPHLLCELAELERYAGRLDRADVLLARAEAALLDSGGKDPQVTAYHASVRTELLGVRGQTLLDRGVPDQAAPFLLEAFARTGRTVDPIAWGKALLRRIHLALAVEDAEGAAALAAEGLAAGELEAAWSAFGPLLQVLRGQALAELERDGRHAPEPAEPVLRGALAEPGLRPAERARAELALAEVLLRQGDVLGAADLLDRAALLAGDARVAAGQRLRHEVRLTAVAAALALARGDGPAGLRAALARADDVLGRFLAAWAEAPRAPDGSGFLLYAGPRQLLSERTRLILRLAPGAAGIDRALQGLLRAQELGTVTRARGGRGVTLAGARALLHPHEGMLVYLPAPDRTHVFALDAERVMHAETAADVALFEVRRRFLLALTTPPPADPAARGRRRAELDWLAGALADVVLPAGLRDRVAGWRRLTIVGIDLLGTLPFEALPGPAGTALGQSHAICYLPSLPLGHALQTTARRDGDVEVALLAVPRPGAALATRFPGLAELAFDAGRAGRLLAPYQDPLVRAGSAGTAASLAELAASTAAVLQVWAHGVHVAAAARPAALVLAPDGGSDGLFGCDRAATLSAPPLVVLAACGAARGPLRRGEDGVGHLGGALLQAGARAVVLPSWDVDEEATFQLYVRFHERLRGHGDDPAEALRQARVRLAEDPRFADPYHHALVHVLGAGHDPLFAPIAEPAALPRWVWLLAGFGGALLVVLARRRRFAASTIGDRADGGGSA